MDIINNTTPDPNLIPLIIESNHLIRSGFKEFYNELLDTTIHNCYLDTTTNELVFQRDKSNLRFDFSLSGLPDVNTSNASSGQVLTYNGSDWVAQDVNSVLAYVRTTPSTRFPDITSVDSIVSALDKILFPYQPPSFGSFGVNGKPDQFELGQWFSSSSGGVEVLSWSVNLLQNISDTFGYTIQDVSTPQTLITGLLPKTTTSSSLNVAPIRYTTQGATHSFSITTRNTNGTNFSRSKSYTWYSKIYYGVSAVDTPLTSPQILGLSNSYFATNMNMNFTINGGGMYIWIAQPVIFGSAISPDFSNSKFNVGGLASSAWYRYTVSHTNASGYTQSFYLYRTVTIQNGTGIKIIIS